MSHRSWSTLWCPGAALLVLAILGVSAPSHMAPVFDNAVQIGGMPAGAVVMAAFWLTLSVVGLVAVRLAHRTETRLGIAVALVVAATILFSLAPALILVLKNVEV